MPVPPIILSIAGYDPSSGAGVTADVKTAASQGCYAATCITALTVQSTQGVFDVQPIEAELVARTLEALVDDLPIAAVKVGMLGSGAVAGTVADFLRTRPLPNVVLDTVIRSSSDAPLLNEGGLDILRTRLIPLADVITPNVDEAAMLAGIEPIDPDVSWELGLPWLRRAAARLRDLGAKAVLITGGHLQSANDYLDYGKFDQTRELILEGERLRSNSTHGTGCAFSTALACQLAVGRDLPEAARTAKEYVHRAILSAKPLGKGTGPVNHFG